MKVQLFVSYPLSRYLADSDGVIDAALENAAGGLHLGSGAGVESDWRVRDIDFEYKTTDEARLGANRLLVKAKDMGLELVVRIEAE